MHQAIEKMPYGIVLLLADGTVTSMNTEAGRILDENDGLSLKMDRMISANKTQTRLLNDMLDRVLETSGTSEGSHMAELSIDRPSGRRALNLLFSGIDRHNFWLLDNPPAAVTFISDPENSPASPAQALQAWYGLTPRESELAVSLLGGDDLARIAEEMSLTRSTVRSYLRSIFKKTETNRQSELVRLLLSLPPMGTSRGG